MKCKKINVNKMNLQFAYKILLFILRAYEHFPNFYNTLSNSLHSKCFKGVLCFLNAGKLVCFFNSCSTVCMVKGKKHTNASEDTIKTRMQATCRTECTVQDKTVLCLVKESTVFNSSVIVVVHCNFSTLTGW